jgi:phosphate transport system protein
MPVRGLLDSELEQINDDVIRMGDRVEEAIRRSVESLLEQDPELAEQVIRDDQIINQLRFDIEDACFTLLATQQPTAIDLRTTVTALNIITDLERIGDHAKGIGQIVVRMGGQDLSVTLPKIPRMAEAVCDMLNTVLDAFVRKDAPAAQRVNEMDDEVDHMYREVFESIIQKMIAREYNVHKGMNLLFAAHNLERIGDRITNIGERIVFMVTGVMSELNL